MDEDCEACHKTFLVTPEYIHEVESSSSKIKKVKKDKVKNTKP